MGGPRIFLLTTNGKKIPGLAIGTTVLASEGVDQFQIVQEDYEGGDS